MKHLRLPLLLILCAFFLLQAGGAGKTDFGPLCSDVGRLLRSAEYTHHKLDAEMSARFLGNLLDTLDFDHLYFLQSDIAGFREKYGATLAKDVAVGDASPAFVIYERFKKRAEERVAKIKLLLKTPLDFTTDRSVEISRKNASWPKDQAEADQLWKDRVTGELLQEKLSATTAAAVTLDGTTANGAVDVLPLSRPGASVEHPRKEIKETEPPATLIERRYDQTLRNINQQSRRDIINTYLTTLAQSYDPHSDYLSKDEMESFDISMKLSLVGIGAVLNSEDGYAKIVQLVPGGPAQMEGHLKEGDRIISVAQGSAQFVDVVGMKLDQVVNLIRGDKGTKVRLKVTAHQGTEAPHIIEITRNQVKLKEQEAKAQLIERTDANGKIRRLGWIALPAFYADFDHEGSSSAVSATTDVRLLLERLKKEKIEGLVIDLRQDGGGSLDESISLAGLFVGVGPVVQTRAANGKISVNNSKDKAAYDGPLIVVTNRLSASASEIFAAALQDYRRAVIVGDESTFGKGTVQTIYDLDHGFLPSIPRDAGALKVTIQKFYRVAGGSTQLRGVTPDIVLPSRSDLADIGEKALINPLPYDEIPPARYKKVDAAYPSLTAIKANSEARVKADPEFASVTADLQRDKAKLAGNRLSLNEAKRQAEAADAKKRLKQRADERAARVRPTTERAFEITLDNVANPALTPADEKTLRAMANNGDIDDPPDTDPSDPKPVDEIRAETLSILQDMTTKTIQPATAQAAPGHL